MPSIMIQKKSCYNLLRTHLTKLSQIYLRWSLIGPLQNCLWQCRSLQWVINDAPIEILNFLVDQKLYMTVICHEEFSLRS